MKKILGSIAIIMVIGFASTFIYLEKVIAEKKITHQLHLHNNLCLNLSAQCVHKKAHQQLTLFCHSGSTYHFSFVTDALEGLKKIAQFDEISLLQKEKTIIFSGPKNHIQITGTDADPKEFESLKAPVPCLSQLTRIEFKSGQN
ncbi:MAG: hypothetical protein ACO20H_12010 [Bacteriovoracaceae bacterium]